MLEVNQGSLYPALQRLEKDGLITSEWGTTDNNRLTARRVRRGVPRAEEPPYNN
ncbi:MAG: helix-turn-helix transcriptional regulator [Gemmatimonadaceae bacterium]